MKRLIRILICAAMPVLLISCLLDKKYRVKSYVLGYYKIERIALASRHNGNQIAVFYIPSEEFGHYPFTRVNFRAEDEYKAIYDALCVKHNDMSYNRTVTINRPDETDRYYFGEYFMSINVVSDRDYDEAHPAGTPLNDVIRCITESLKPYIDSGYRDTYDWANPTGLSETFLEYLEWATFMTLPQHNVFHPVDKMLSDIAPGDLSLMGFSVSDRGSFGLHFESQPTLSREHTFTVTLTADDGRIFTGTVDNTFE